MKKLTKYMTKAQFGLSAIYFYEDNDIQVFVEKVKIDNSYFWQVATCTEKTGVVCEYRKTFKKAKELANEILNK